MTESNYLVVYISGQISGVPNGNRFAFNNAALKIKKEFGENCTVINPVLIGENVDKIFAMTSEEIGGEVKPTWHDYMKNCIRELTRASHILMLDGWKKSDGAKVEKDLAEKLGIKVCFSFDELVNSCKQVVTA